MVEAEKIQVRQLRNDGYSDRQLQEMGFCEPAILRAPAVAMKSI
jgi:Fe2+ transport system protein FeoA